MARLLIRNLDDATVEILNERAKKHGRSLSSEARFILEQAVARDWKQQIEQVRALFEGREFSDSSKLVREDRERCPSRREESS